LGGGEGGEVHREKEGEGRRYPETGGGGEEGKDTDSGGTRERSEQDAKLDERRGRIWRKQWEPVSDLQSPYLELSPP
jgi:hypothetical protein